MYTYCFSEEEQSYLKQYDGAKYEKPSVAADMAIFSIMEEEESNNFRKLPKKALKILLVKRAGYPFKDMWALPGGFCNSSEDVYETAQRKLFQETNVKNAYLSLAGVFGQAGRDPRGWIISNTFLALVDGKACHVHPGNDVREADWFSVEVTAALVKKEITEGAVDIWTDYEISLLEEKEDITLVAKVREYKHFQNCHETVKYEILENSGLGFDHAKIILSTLLELRKNIRNDIRIGFDLMPELFTLTQLQNAFELVLDEKLLTANFRRKINDYVVETEQIIEGAGHRPAKLYKRNVEEFYR